MKMMVRKAGEQIIENWGRNGRGRKQENDKHLSPVNKMVCCVSLVVHQTPSMDTIKWVSKTIKSY